MAVLDRRKEANMWSALDEEIVEALREGRLSSTDAYADENIALLLHGEFPSETELLRLIGLAHRIVDDDSVGVLA